MQTVTQLYETILNQRHITEIKLTINGVDYREDVLISLETNGDIFGTDMPEMGLAISRGLDVEMLTESSVIPRMAQMIPYVRLRSGNQVSEWVQKGVYFIDTRETTPDNHLVIQGFDAMLKTEMLYPSSSLSFPAKDINVVREIATKIGVEVDARTVMLMNQNFQIPFPAEFTMREVLKGIAGLYGGSFLMNDLGKLQLVCFWDRASETFYLTDENGNRILFGGDRILLDSRRWENA